MKNNNELKGKQRLGVLLLLLLCVSLHQMLALAKGRGAVTEYSCAPSP